MSKIKILLVDDHPIFRQGLRDVLETDPNLEVIGEAADSEVAIDHTLNSKPDVIFMDVNLPSMNGIQVTKKITSLMPDMKVIIITGHDNLEQVYHALRAGARAYCPKDTTPQILQNTVYSVFEGNYVVGERVMTHSEMQDWVEEKIGFNSIDTSDISLHDALQPLSPREMQILALVTNGRSNKEIAFNLGISHQTVKNHMTAILRKLRVEDRTQAAIYALRHGWVELGQGRTFA